MRRALVIAGVMLAGLLQESGNAVGGQEHMEESELPKINSIVWRNNILGFAPVLSGKVQVNGRDEEIEGTYFDKSLPLSDDPGYHTGQKAISPYWKLTGEWPNDERYEALAGRQRSARQRDMDGPLFGGADVSFRPEYRSTTT